jgi:CRISPR-associated endonuclease Cas2
MAAGKSWHLVAYDIGAPKRLQKVHRYLKKTGIPVQYSVFLVYVTRAELDALSIDLSALLDLKVDDLRLYPCQSAQHIWLAGKQARFWQTTSPQEAQIKQKDAPGQQLTQASNSPRRKKNKASEDAKVVKKPAGEKRHWFWQF